MRIISLDELETRTPTEMTRCERVAVLCRLAALQTRVASQLADDDGGSASPNGGGRLLDVNEAAARLKMSAQWLYRHGDLPFVVPMGRKKRYSAAGIDEYIASRRLR